MYTHTPHTHTHTHTPAVFKFAASKEVWRPLGPRKSGAELIKVRDALPKWPRGLLYNLLLDSLVPHQLSGRHPHPNVLAHTPQLPLGISHQRLVREFHQPLPRRPLAKVLVITIETLDEGMQVRGLDVHWHVVEVVFGEGARDRGAHDRGAGRDAVLPPQDNLLNARVREKPLEKVESGWHLAFAALGMLMSAAPCYVLWEEFETY
mmetsp:Transcript_78585/g.157167  ORF Transcript_78585/g.157167 Transcript_78585/m.157167 type:complete len:206 (+) Transcript_78585:258-875(+)